VPISIDEGIQLVWLRSFLAVHRTGSFTAAAREMHRAQSRISDQVAQLEHLLGAQLFIRGRTHARLTSAGWALVPYAQEVLRQLQQGASAVGDHDGEVHGEVTLRGYPGVSAFVLAPLIAHFRGLFPRVTVQLSEHGSDSAAMVLRGEVDLAVEADTVPSHPRLRVTPLSEEPIVCLVHADHPLAKADRLDPHQLAGETLVLTGDPRFGVVPCRRYLESSAIPGWREYLVAHPTTVTALVGAGAGIGVLPALAAALLDPGPDVCCLGVVNQEWRRHVVLLADGSRRYPRAVNHLVAEMLRWPLPEPLLQPR